MVGRGPDDHHFDKWQSQTPQLSARTYHNHRGCCTIHVLRTAMTKAKHLIIINPSLIHIRTIIYPTFDTISLAHLKPSIPNHPTTPTTSLGIPPLWPRRMRRRSARSRARARRPGDLCLAKTGFWWADVGRGMSLGKQKTTGQKTHPWVGF